MISLALIGNNITHSLSHRVYEELIGKTINYSFIDCGSEEELPKISKLFEYYDGVSITSPYKQSYIREVKLDYSSQRVRGINCLALLDGKFCGRNTDYLALREIIPLRIRDFMNVIVLGDGVMARVVTCILSEMKVKHIIFSRKVNGNIDELNLGMYERSIVINCCSRNFCFSGDMSIDSIFWDMNYSNSFQKNTIEGQGVAYEDGYDLLKLQAQFALDFWRIPYKNSFVFE